MSDTEKKSTFRETYQEAREQTRKQRTPSVQRAEYFRMCLGVYVLVYGLVFYIPTMAVIKNYGVPKEIGVGVALIIALLLGNLGARKRARKKYGAEWDKKSE